MYYVEDEHFAWRLQSELQAYDNFKRQKEDIEKENLNPIDSVLEYTDPTPNIHELFVKFDRKFFWNTLGMVQVLWSNKMTKCAGMCSFEGGHGLCKISLSAPLLSLRPRKDLVETLLHEMIHAYLFVTHNNKDREDHGAEFHKHMFRINKEAGTKISVYHTFYDEVEYYQKHIWRCNGLCQKKKPYFGFVRRAINRAPGPHDNWWNRHQLECGGVFVKISEPEKNNKTIKKTREKKPCAKNKDIRDFFTKNTISETNIKSQNNKTSNIKTLSDYKSKKEFSGEKINITGGTIVLSNNHTNKKNIKAVNKGNQNLTKLKEKPSETKNSNKIKVVSTGVKNTNLFKGTKLSERESETDKVKETVRNFWANKFLSCESPEKNLLNDHSPKKIKLECPVCLEGFPDEEIQSHLEDCLKNEINPETEEKNFKPETVVSEKINEMKECPVCSENILQKDMNDHLEKCINLIFEIECDSDFDNEVKCESVPCPCCFKWFQESEMNNHIDECLTLHTLKEEILVS